jgi:thioredoxin-dependent peroxiredoxin
MQAFQRDLHRFEESNAQVLGVSTDSLRTQQEFGKKYGLAFPLIADVSGAVQKLYTAGRVTFLINQAGTIRSIQKGIPDNEALLRALS